MNRKTKIMSSFHSTNRTQTMPWLCIYVPIISCGLYYISHDKELNAAIQMAREASGSRIGNVTTPRHWVICRRAKEQSHWNWQSHWRPQDSKASVYWCNADVHSKELLQICTIREVWSDWVVQNPDLLCGSTVPSCGSNRFLLPVICEPCAVFLNSFWLDFRDQIG